MDAFGVRFVLAIALGLHAAQGESESAQRLDARLAEARLALDARKFAPAREILVAALHEHTGPQEEILRRWYEFEDALQQASFWRGYRPPEPEAVVGGDLESWDPSSGKIKLRYRAKDGALRPAAAGSGAERSGDFIATEDVFLHPMVFKGPYQIELKGKELAERGFPTVLVAWEWNSLRGIDYGAAYAVQFSYGAEIYAFEGGDLRWLDSSTQSMPRGRPYTFTVRVAPASVTASYNGSFLLKVDRAPGPFGQFGFNAFDNLDEVVVTGEIEPAWITGLVDERIQADWEQFVARFDPFDGLPAWTRARVGGEGLRLGAFGYAAPAPAGPSDLPVLEKVRQFDEQGKALGHREAVEHAFAGVDWDGLEREFESYLTSLR